MRKYFDTVLDIEGRPVPGAQITALDLNGDPLPLFSEDGGAEIEQPLETNSLGYFEFFAPDETYSLQISYEGAATVTINGVQIYDDAADRVVTSRALLLPSGETNLVVPPVAERAGKFFAWGGGGQPVASPGSGGADPTLRTDLADASGAGLIGTYGGSSVQADLDARPTAAELALSNASEGIGFIQIGDDAEARTVQDKLRDIVNAADFGAVGDGVADDTTALKNALVVAAGRTLMLGQAQTYLIASDELVMADGTSLDMNGSTLNFAVAGSKMCLAPGNNCRVFGGTITNTAGTAGLEGTYQTPIVIGRYTQLAGRTNVEIRDMTIGSVTPGGNGIAIFGDSSGVTIENIDFGDSSTLAIGVLTHWSFDGGETTPAYAGVTTHPRNIRINNIRLGTWTYGVSNSLTNAAVFLSGSYNIDVSNVYALKNTHGSAVAVYAGDWGFQFATAMEQALGLAGISIRNLYGQHVKGVHVVGKNTLQSVVKVWPGSVLIDNACVYGISADAESKGARIEGCDGVTITGSVFDAFYQSAYLGGVVTNLRIEKSQFRNSARNGLEASGAAAGSGGITLLANKFSGNNSAVAANVADINLVNIAGIVIDKNEFDSANSTWNVRADNTVSRLRAIDNHTVNVGDGPCYSFGAAGDTAICIQYQGNTSDVSPATGVRGGQVIIPAIITTRNASADAQRLIHYNAAPDRGAWNRGDVCWNSQPAVGAAKGWQCTVSGSPGTWVSMGNL